MSINNPLISCQPYVQHLSSNAPLHLPPLVIILQPFCCISLAPRKTPPSICLCDHCPLLPPLPSGGSLPPIEAEARSFNFPKVVEEFEHQEVCMPYVPDPETLPNLEELRERRLSDPNLSTEYRNKIASKKFIPWPIEIRGCDAITFSEQSQPRLKYWFKARGKLTNDPALHRCVVAYASDLIFGGISLNPHRRRGLKTASLSLDHSIWFHRPVRADDWLLFVMESPSASGGRGLCIGQMFNKNGQLIMSLTQEGLIRQAKVAAQNEVPKSKL